MATRAAMAYRDAEVQKRLDQAVSALAERFQIEPPPPFPPVRDQQYRAIDERDWMATTLERVAAAAEEMP